MARPAQNLTSDAFTVPEIAVLTGETGETIRALFRGKSDSVTEAKGKKYVYRISQSEVERIISEKSEGVISLLGLFVIFSVAHRNGGISDEQYLNIREKTMRKFHEAVQYPASRRLLNALMDADNMDKLIMRLYHDATQLDN